MPGATQTQSLRYGYVTDPLSYTMQRDLADDIAAQLDVADAARTAAMKRPVARVARNTTLSLPASTVTVVPWTSITAPDTHGMVDLVGQPNRVTVNAASGTGTYWAIGNIQLLYTAWTRADIMIYRNGVFYAQRTWRAPSDLTALEFTVLVNLPTIGDYLSMHVYHEGGGTTSGDTFGLRVFKNSN
jgi:hypothetical protein